MYNVTTARELTIIVVFVANGFKQSAYMSIQIIYFTIIMVFDMVQCSRVGKVWDLTINREAIGKIIITPH